MDTNTGLFLAGFGVAMFLINMLPSFVRMYMDYKYSIKPEKHDGWFVVCPNNPQHRWQISDHNYYPVDEKGRPYCPLCKKSAKLEDKQ